MDAALDRTESESNELEERALERMIGSLCNHVDVLLGEARERGRLDSREADFQCQAFAERRGQADRALAHDTSESQKMRIARLQRLADALDCSRHYFLGIR